MNTTIHDHFIAKRLTVKDLAERLDVAPVTVRRWIGAGEAPAHIRIGRIIRFRLEDIEAWEIAALRSSPLPLDDLQSRADHLHNQLDQLRADGPSPRPLDDPTEHFCSRADLSHRDWLDEIRENNGAASQTQEAKGSAGNSD